MNTQADYQLSRAMSLWNHHTSPSAMRSDFEHMIHRKAARKLKTWIDRHFSYGRDYVETDSGRLVNPKPYNS